jgi:hypothetical protein
LRNLTTKEDIRNALMRATPEQRLDALARSGRFTILNHFDSLPWLRGAADWTAWRAFLAASYGLPLNSKELEIYREATGRLEAPKKKAREVWMVCGRRARKSAIAATLGVFEAAYRDHRAYLAPGERAQIPIIAKNKSEAAQIRNYVEAILTSTPELSHLIEGQPKIEEIRLRNRCDFAIRTASLSAVSSKTVPLFIGDEMAFWMTDDSANPDREIIAHVKPAQLLVPGSMIVGLSSPYARRGVLYDRYSEFYSRDGDILVWKAPTLSMHDTPEVRAEVEKAYVDDEASARAEYGAEFRDDVTTFLTEAVLDGVIDDYQDIPPQKGIHYVAYVDPSGGSSDSFTLAVAHFEPASGVVVDRIVEWRAPFDPGEVVVEVVAILREYGCTRVSGDNYAGRTFSGLFRRLEIAYHVMELKRSDIYRGFLPLINGKLCRLPLNKVLRKQLLSLDRRSLASGKEIIDHPKDAHDDVANAVAGVVVMADKLRRERTIEEEKPDTTYGIFLDRFWSGIREARGERKKPDLGNPYAR